MIGYCFLGSVPTANHKRLKTEGNKYSRLVHFPLSSIMPPPPPPQCFEIDKKNWILRPANDHVSASLYSNSEQTKGGLFFPGRIVSVTTASRYQRSDPPLMTRPSVIQSNPQSRLWGALRVMALVVLSSPILPLPPLLSVVNCRVLSY